MNKLQTIFDQILSFYHKYDYAFFISLTLMSVLFGQTTPFYVIYFFWCNELIYKVVDRIFYKLNPNAVVSIRLKNSLFGSFFMMGIYLVFIVVFFGFIANHDNSEIVLVNMNVLFFHNWFFNVNLMLVLADRIFMHVRHKPVNINFSGFTANMIVLHLSIIIGAFLMLLVVRNFPTVFTPENFLGSVIIITPFLLLKLAVLYFTSPHKLNTITKKP